MNTTSTSRADVEYDCKCYLAHFSVLILVVLVLRALLGRRGDAEMRYALWGMVLVRLLLPVQLYSLNVSLGMAGVLFPPPSAIVESNPAENSQQDTCPSGEGDSRGEDASPGEPAGSGVSPEKPAETELEGNALVPNSSAGLHVQWGPVLLWV